MSTPSVERIFKVREDADRKLLGKDWDTEFHHSVAQILFTTTQVSKYIQIYVEDITTRVRIPNKDYWRKL